MQMKRWFILFLPVLMLALSACNDEENKGPATVALNFQGVFGDDPLLMYERAYDYPEDMQTKFQLFHFYLSDVVLLPENPAGEEVKLVDIDLITFKDIQDETTASQGVTIYAEDVPAGSYRGIRLGIGVPMDLNQTQPGDYPPGHVLTDNYWSWAMGYVFFKIEGNADIDNDGIFGEKLTFHIGLQDFYRTKTFEEPIRLGGDETRKFSFKVDLKDVLAPSSSQFVDFRQVTQDHTNDLDLAAFLADNLRDAIELETE